MKPEPDFYALRESAPVLPEQELWRAVIHRAVLDVQYGSQGQAKNVLSWTDTDDFDRVLAWTGLEVDPGRAAKALREIYAARFDGTQQLRTSAEPEPMEDMEPPPGFPLALVLAVRDLQRSKQRQRRRQLARAPRWSNMPVEQSPELFFGETIEATTQCLFDSPSRDDDVVDWSEEWESATSGECE